MNQKPIGIKNYGSIPHLPNSRMGPSDRSCHFGQARIATLIARDRHDLIIITEKLDGSNVGVARVGDKLYALGRAGYLAISSPYLQHRIFHQWVARERERFMAALAPGERVVGEWLAQAHGTRYNLFHEPFVVFDWFDAHNVRLPYSAFANKHDFVMAHLVHSGGPISTAQAMTKLGTFGYHGAIDPAEGVVYRVERRGKVDFLAKYVRADKVDGKYLDDDVWNYHLPNPTRK